MQFIAYLSRLSIGLAFISASTLLVTLHAQGGSPRPRPPDAPRVSIVAVGEVAATGWISRCTKDGAALASCTQQIHIVPRDGECFAEALVTAMPSAKEVWDAVGLSAGVQYTLYGISSNATGSTCSEPLNFAAAGQADAVQRIQFYPSLDYLFRPDAGVGATQVRFVLRSDPPVSAVSEVTVSVDSNGDFRATVTCSFAGDGVLDVINDSPGAPEDVLDSIPILCDVEGLDVVLRPSAGFVG